MSGSSGGIRAGKTFIEVYCDKTSLGRDLKQIEKQVAEFGSKVAGIGKAMLAGGAAVLAPLAGAATAFAAMGSDLNDMSSRTGASVEALSTLGFAAKQSGADMETVEGSMRKMAKTLSSADDESKQARESLAKLGLEVGDLAGMSPEEKFRVLGDRLSKISDPTKRAAAAMAIFGKSGTKLLPMFEQGAEGLKAMEDQARALGLEFSTADAASADSLGDALDALWDQLKMGTAQIGAALAPSIRDLTTAASGFLAQAITWIRENRELIATVFKVAAGVGAAGVAVYALGTAISLGSTLFGAAGATIGFVTTAVTALLSPIGLVSAAAVALGYYLVTSTEMGQGALAWLGESFNWLKDEALGAWEGISDALAAGDLGLAAKIAWAAIKAAFLEGTLSIRQTWSSMTFSLSSLLIDATAGLETAWLEVTDFFADAWRIVCDGIAGAWDSTVGFVQKLWLRLKQLLGEDVDAGEFTSIDQANEDAAKRREEARDKEIGDRDQARQAEKRNIEAGRQGAQQALAEDADGEQKRLADETKAARDKLDALKAEAKAKREGLPQPGAPKKPGGEGIDEIDVEGKLKAAKKDAGISSSDVRETEGLKSIVGALNRGKDDPAKESAATLKKMYDLQYRQWKDGKDVRDKLVNRELVG